MFGRQDYEACNVVFLECVMGQVTLRLICQQTEGRLKESAEESKEAPITLVE